MGIDRGSGRYLLDRGSCRDLSWRCLGDLSQWWGFESGFQTMLLSVKASAFPPVLSQVPLLELPNFPSRICCYPQWHHHKLQRPEEISGMNFSSSGGAPKPLKVGGGVIPVC